VRGAVESLKIVAGVRVDWPHSNMGNSISQLRNSAEYFYLAIDFQGDKLGITYTDDPKRDRRLASSHLKIRRQDRGFHKKQKREIRNEALKA
jgi:hypothetical protein